MEDKAAKGKQSRTKRRGGVLPDLDELQEAKKKRKRSVRGFQDGCSAFGQVDLASCMDGSDSLDEDACAAWLVNKFGWKRFLSIVTVQKEIPASLTTQQCLAYISQWAIPFYKCTPLWMILGVFTPSQDAIKTSLPPLDNYLHTVVPPWTHM